MYYIHLHSTVKVPGKGGIENQCFKAERRQFGTSQSEEEALIKVKEKALRRVFENSRTYKGRDRTIRGI